jgi:hypothetical protein
MNLIDILKMGAGQNLNRLVHLIVFGKSMSMVVSLDDIPDYSRDMSYAFAVAEKLMSMGYRYVMRGNFEGNGLHWAGFDYQEWADQNPPFQSPLCKSLPEAICKAALIAVLKERGELEV